MTRKSTSTPTVFVCSATGTQGTALCRQLIGNGWNVHATVRDADTTSAKALATLGVELALGDWDNEPALRASIAECDKLFLNLVPDFRNWDSERLHAQRILTIAKAAGLKHVVYSSAVSANAPEKRCGMDPTSAAHKLFFMKNTIEGIVQRAGFEFWTILRPGFFMANLLEPKVRLYPDLINAGVFKTAMTADTMLNMVDHEDIAKFAVAAFQDPQRYNQQAIEVVSEALTPAALVEQLSIATGREFQAVCYTDAEIKDQIAVNPLIESQLSMRTSNRFVDMDKIKSWGIPLSTFRHFLDREIAAVNATYLPNAIRG